MSTEKKVAEVAAIPVGYREEAYPIPGAPVGYSRVKYFSLHARGGIHMIAIVPMSKLTAAGEMSADPNVVISSAMLGRFTFRTRLEAEIPDVPIGPAHIAFDSDFDHPILVVRALDDATILTAAAHLIRRGALAHLKPGASLISPGSALPVISV